MALPAKRTGRGFERITETPCKKAAEELRLDVHVRDTFTNWEIPAGTNLIIAVSFGLFVPPRILHAAKYGGLNVHPSLLPDLRGPAPIHHALLRGDQYTGVSLQTMDEHAFDHGAILAQTPSPGYLIHPDVTLDRLTSLLAHDGARMLVQGLRDHVHVPPYRSVGWRGVELANRQLYHAPKVTKADFEVNWDTWTADDFLRHTRVMNSVWTHSVNKKGMKRLLLHEISIPTPEDISATNTAMTIPFLQTIGRDDSKVLHRSVKCLKDGGVVIELRGGEYIKVKLVMVEGKPLRVAAATLRSFLIKNP